MEDRKERIRYYLAAAFIGILLLLNFIGIFRTIFGIDTAIFITLLAGYKTFYNSISALLEKRISADIALCVAVIAALAVGQYLAAAEAMFIVMVGEGLESYAAGRTAAAIQGFVEQLPRRARVIRENGEDEVDAASLVAADLILVRPGERIPADGVIERGFSDIDESSISGEPLPQEKQTGDEAFAGSLNGNGLLHIRVSRAGSETTLARVIKLVEEAQQKRAPVERLADRAAVYFLPALLVAAALTYLCTRDWLRTVSVLIVACPCALILATPTAMVAAIGGLARRGILVRGASVLQRCSKVDTIVFDKTGTLTEGQFEIVRVVAFNRDEQGLLAISAAAEKASSHALGRVIVSEAERRGITITPAENVMVRPGRGIECEVGDQSVRVGNAAFLAEGGVQVDTHLLTEADRLGATVVLVSIGSRLAGGILLRDRLRDGVRACFDGIAEVGAFQKVMLTGDRRRTAEVIAREAGINSVDAELLPEQKVDRIRHFESQGHVLAMVGDGINDAPALASADVGIAVAGASDITAEAADVVYLPHSLEHLPHLFETSRRAVNTAWQNIIFFAGAVNLAAVICAATGILGPIGAALTHQLSSFLVMMNSLRLLRVKHSIFGLSPLFEKTPLRQLLLRLHHATARIDLNALRRRVSARPVHFARGAALVIAGMVLLNGVYVIPADQIGIVQRFGKKLLPYNSPGLHYKLPWPIERLTRVQAHKIRTVEIGYRSSPSSLNQEPAAYEWNIQHRYGQFQLRPEESLMLTGDQNMIELTAAVHYDLVHPDDFLFRQLQGDETVRSVAEGVIVSVVGESSLDDVLTTGRKAVEQKARSALQARLDHDAAGVRILSLRLLDVHPSQEVVGAFREVSGAYEEKNRMINEAEAYRNEQVALARGNAKAALQNAKAYSLDRINRAWGDANRFSEREAAFRNAPGPTATRLYFEAIDEVLPGKKKLILDKTKSQRRLFLIEDSMEISGPLLMAPQPESRKSGEEP